MKYLNDISTTRMPWLILAFSALALELCALVFQYIMGLAPCIMCVYQRLAIISIIAGGFVGAIGCKNILARTFGYALWGTGAIWGLITAMEHVEMQEADSFYFSCELIPNFPTWAPLHEWVPFLFEATGDCGKISWEFLGYSMPQWMTVNFGLYSLAFIFVLANRLIISKKP